MKIDKIQLYRVALELKHSFQTSSHRKRGLEHILVSCTDSDGTVGWGEIASPSDPYYCSETTETTWLIAEKYLIPLILAKEFATPAELESSWYKIRGHNFAKAGFSIAAWDLFAKQSGLSLATTLGGTRTQVQAGVSLGIEPTIDDLLEQVSKHIAAGYSRVKLKIAAGWDVEPVRAVRSAYPNHDFHVDANGAYPDSDEALSHLSKLDAYGLTMIEQPFAPRNFTAHAKFQTMIDTPVCLDESVDDFEDLKTMLALKAGRVLNIKVSRMGGLAEALKAHNLALEHDIPVWCGGMHEFGIGRAANLAISSLTNFKLPSDVSASDKYYARDVIVPPVVANQGEVTVPTDAGIGFSVDEDWILANTQQSLVRQAE